MAGRGGLGVGTAQLGCVGGIDPVAGRLLAQLVVSSPRAPASLGEEAGPARRLQRVAVRIARPAQGGFDFSSPIPSTPGPADRIVVLRIFDICTTRC